MIQLDRILCPIDYSETSDRALDYAGAMAKWFGCSLDVLRVLVPFQAMPLGVEVPAQVEIAQGDRDAERNRLEQLVEPLRSQGVTVTVALREGTPASEILDHANAVAASLLVIGTHGRGGFERLMLGSVAEKVLRKTSCPVLTIPPGVRHETLTIQEEYKRILCATDFSRDASVAVQYASSLAKEADATLTLLYVVQTYLDEIASPGAAYLETLEHAAMARLQSAVPADARPYCEIKEVVTVGRRASRVILKTAEELGVGLVVMGAHGRHALDRFFFGSTTHRVITKANAPVLTLRSR